MSLSDDASAESLTTDQALDLLNDERRRRALAVLRETAGAMELGELAAATAARAEDVVPAAVSTDRRERTAASLHHCHLPKLADAGVVAYDRAENRADVTESVEELEPYFEVIRMQADAPDA